MTRPKVLLIAEAANPEWVSVPLVGWSLATALRAVADVHIVTQVRNRDAFLRAGLVEGSDFSATDTEAFARPMWKLAEKLRMGEGKGWTMVQALNALSYPFFERLVWKRFGASITGGSYDLVHRVTPLSPTIASPLAARCARVGMPFVLGPLNGGVPWPKGFEAERRAEREWLSYVRAAYKLLPGRGKTLKFADAIIAGSRHTASEIPRRYRDKTIYIPENGIDPARFNTVADPSSDGPLRAAFVGRLVPYKGADMLLDAGCDLMREGRLKIDIIGDGPMASDLAIQARMLRVSDGVTFHGWQPHEAVQTILSDAHVLSFPSIREFGGGVVLEAMALGVVPMIVDYAGPGELVGPETGIKLPCTSREGIVDAFRKALTALCHDRTALPAMAEAGRARVQGDFLWSQKARQVAQVYDWVLSGREGAAPAPF